MLFSVECLNLSKYDFIWPCKIAFQFFYRRNNLLYVLQIECKLSKDAQGIFNELFFPIIENEMELCVLVFAFFFLFFVSHAVSGTTNNHWTGPSDILQFF